MRFHQHLPNMVHVYLLTSLHDAIWFMNIHEQREPYLEDADENAYLFFLNNISSHK
jgi:hypothetical protein